MLSSFRPKELALLTQGRWIGREPSVASIANLSTDTRTLVPGEVFVALRGEKYDANNYLEQALAKNPSLVIAEKELARPNVPFLLVPDTLKALVAIARELRSRFKGTVIGVTGSAGKSSTKEMVAALLGPGTVKSPASFNNLLGVSKTLWLLEDTTKYLVLEMGMNQFGEIAELCHEFRPHIGAITNIGDAHIGKLGGQEGVYKAKKELFDYLAGPNSGGVGVALNVDDNLVVRALREAHADSLKILKYGFSSAAADVRVLKSEMNPQTGFLKVSLCLSGVTENVELPIFGKHHAQNLAAAVAVVSLAGISKVEMLKRVSLLRPAIHRGEILVLSENRTLIDESYNSNPKALASSLESLALMDPRRRRIVVVGEMRELGQFGGDLHYKAGETFVAAQTPKSPPTIVIGVGELTENFLNPIRKAFPSMTCLQVGTDRDALIEINKVFKSGDILFIKGSRGVQLDSIVSALAGR